MISAKLTVIAAIIDGLKIHIKSASTQANMPNSRLLITAVSATVQRILISFMRFRIAHTLMSALLVLVSVGTKAPAHASQIVRDTNESTQTQTMPPESTHVPTQHPTAPPEETTRFDVIAPDCSNIPDNVRQMLLQEEFRQMLLRKNIDCQNAPPYQPPSSPKTGDPATQSKP